MAPENKTARNQLMQRHVFFYCSSPNSPVNKRRQMCLLLALDRIELLLLLLFLIAILVLQERRTK